MTRITFTAVYFFDQNMKQKEEIDGVIYVGTDLIGELLNVDCKICLEIGSNEVRKRLNEEFNIPVEKYIALIHSTAVISSSASVGRVTVLEHNNRLRDFVHVSLNATLAGTVKVGEGTHVGSGATVIPGREIGKWSVVGAVAVVTKGVENEVTVVGVPAGDFVGRYK